MTVVRQDLDAVECNNPHCPGDHPIVIYAKCHPESSLATMYDKTRGVLILVCCECNNRVAEIEVAAAPVQ